MSEKDLYRFLRGLLDVIFMGRRLYRKFGKKKVAAPRPYFQRVSDMRCDRVGPVDPSKISYQRQRDLATNFERFGQR